MELVQETPRNEATATRRLTFGDALRGHWPEYLMEAVELGAFMVSACLFTVLLEHPDSPVRHALPDGTVRRILGGIAMGLTAIGLVYSPFGKQSGAHMNPSVTLTFYRLGKVAGWDAVFYVLFQFIGGLGGVLLSAAALPKFVGHPSVNYAVTVPGPQGTEVAFLAEAAISFLMMLTVLVVSNNQRIARFTGIVAGCLVATYISLEAPFSGMSMNPARTVGSALPARVWSAMWIYFTAPPLGMLLAAETYLRIKGAKGVFCAKYHHQNPKRCIFCLTQAESGQ